MSVAPQKSCRIVTYNAVNIQHMKSVKIITSLTADIHHSIKQFLQLTSTQWTADAAKGIHHPTYMDDTANPAGLPTIYIAGYSAPN